MNSKLKKWRNKIDSVQKDVWMLLNFRSVFHQLNEMYTLNHKSSDNLLFFDFIFYSYVAWACVAIRRLTEINKNGYSLRQLIEDIAKNPIMLSRSYYREIYSNTVVSQHYNQDFDMYVVNNGKHIDPNDVSLDITALNDLYIHFEGFIDKVVVHKDNALPQTVPSWQDLDDAINIIERITLKYVKGIKASNLTALYSETKLTGKKFLAF